MYLTPNTVKFKHSNAQKLFGCIGGQVKGFLPLLSGVNVKVKKGKRCKSKKNSGTDHVLQCLAAKLCGHKSDYKMTEPKTPKTLKKIGVHFLQKSTHYDNVENIDIDTVWQVKAQLLQKYFALPEQLTAMLDSWPCQFEGEYEAKRTGYIGREKGQSVTGDCHQLFSVTLAGFKQFLYKLRCPGNYVAFSNPKEHGDCKLSGLNFDNTIARHAVMKVHALCQKKRFLWLFDRGFGDHDFWAWLKELGDDFVTSLDSNAECVKQEQRLVDSGAVVLKNSKGFDFRETIVQVKNMNLKAVYVKPHDSTPPYWLVTTRYDLTGEEIKKTYNMRSGDEPVYDYLKNDFNAKKPCKKNFAGAQAHTALLCLVHDIISLLSQQIFGAYHRLTTIVGLVIELTALELMFLPAPKKQFRAPLPITCPAIGMQKKVK